MMFISKTWSAPPEEARHGQELCGCCCDEMTKRSGELTSQFLLGPTSDGARDCHQGSTSLVPGKEEHLE